MEKIISQGGKRTEEVWIKKMAKVASYFENRTNTYRFKKTNSSELNKRLDIDWKSSAHSWV